MKKCLGCGQILQNNIPNKKGYVINLDNDYCLRCFKIKHYNELIQINDVDETTFSLEVNKIIDESSKDDHFFYILDVFNLDATRVRTIESKLTNDNATIVINKIDLLPRSTNNEKLLEYVESIFRNTNISNAEICLFSSTKKWGLDELIESLDSYKNNYFIGKTNVGKSSIINAIIKSLGEEPKIVESYFSNTTMDKIIININEDMNIIDTPGIAETESFEQITIPKDWKLLFFKKEVKQFSFKLTNQQSFIYGSIFSIDFDLIDTRDIHFYINGQVDLHRTNQRNLEEYYSKNWNKVSPQVIRNEKLKIFNLELDEKNFNKKINIAIQDLGWISLELKKGDKITYHIPDMHVNPLITIRPNLM